MAVTDRSVAPDLLQRNLEALRRRDPDLATRIEHAPTLPPDAVVPTRNGAVTVQCPTVDGHRVFLHSRYDPQTEARRLIDQHPTDGLVSYFVLGLGMGYHVRELYRRASPESLIVVLERDLSLARTALSHLDFSDVLVQPRLVLLVGPSQGQIVDRLNAHLATIFMGTRYVVHQPSDRIDPPYYKRMRRILADFVAYGKTSLTTLVANNYTTNLNVCMNLAHYCFTPDLDILKDRFKGYPGLVVSAGPSLSRNRHLLPKAKGRMVVISVPTILRSLIEDGTPPDFVTFLDYHEISRRFFEHVTDFGDLHLVAEPKGSWQAMDAYSGLMSALHNPFAQGCLRGLGLRKAGLRAGATVAHLAFYLAEYMGCDPIVLVGQDLGFSDGVYYAPGATIHDLWRPELNRFQTIEMKEWERIVRRRPFLTKVTDIHGQEIYSDDQMLTYLQQFVRDFGMTEAHVIDATEGGALKEGAEIMSLAQAIDQYATRPIPQELFAYRRTVVRYDLSRRDQVLAELHTRIRETHEMEDLCAETVRILEEIRDHIDDQAHVNRLLVRIDALRDEVSQRRHEQHALLAALAQTAELTKFRHDKQIAALGLKGIERQRRQAERDIEYVGDLQRTCASLVDMLERAVERVEAFVPPGEDAG